jgi:hypothetical protein
MIHDAIADIQIAAADPTTPVIHNVVAAPVALAFESTFKRHSSDGRDATVDVDVDVDGVHSHQACPWGLQQQERAAGTAYKR